jgi:DNA-binding NarL/FixJ family response regulator
MPTASAPPGRKALFIPPGCCWRSAACCDALGTGEARSSGCAGRTTCTRRCATPFVTRADEELAACRLPGAAARKQSVLALTSRETEVAHLVGRGLSNPEIAAELFISRKAVEYHLSNIYAKCGLPGRQQLRRFVEQWGQPTAV